MPPWLRENPRLVPASNREELDRLGQAARRNSDLSGLVESLFDRMLPSAGATSGRLGDLAGLLAANGFNREQHERVRAGLRCGLIGLTQNRLPASSVIEDVRPGDVTDARGGARGNTSRGAGSRWTRGAGVVRALHRFAKLAGRRRTFLEIHLAKSTHVATECRTGAARVHHRLPDP